MSEGWCGVRGVITPVSPLLQRCTPVLLLCSSNVVGEQQWGAVAFSRWTDAGWAGGGADQEISEFEKYKRVGVAGTYIDGSKYENLKIHNSMKVGRWDRWATIWLGYVKKTFREL